MTGKSGRSASLVARLRFVLLISFLGDGSAAAQNAADWFENAQTNLDDLIDQIEAALARHEEPWRDRTRDTARRDLEPRRRDQPPPVIDAFREAHGDFADDVRRFTPMVQITGLYDPDGSIHTEPGEFRLLDGDLQALVPIPVTADTFWLVGAHAGAKDYDFDSATEGAFDDTLYNFGLRFGLGHFFTEDFVLQGYWQPSVYSDLEGSFEMDDVRLEYGAILAAYRVRDDFFLKAGLAFTDALDTGVIPLGGFSWRMSERWRLDVLPPRSIEVSFRPGGAVHLLLGTELDAEEYHLRDPRSAGGKAHFVHVQDIRTYVGAIIPMTRHTSFVARLGTAIAGRYDWNAGAGPNYRGDREPAAFAEVGIGWTF